MVLVDHEEMHRILSLLEIVPAYSTGGSAANAAFNAARLGLRTTFLGKLGNDALADSYRTSFEATGVDGSRFKRGALPNARCLALVTPDAQRTMRTCLAAAMTLSPAEISVADFADAATRTSKAIWCSIRRSRTPCWQPLGPPAAPSVWICRPSKSSMLRATWLFSQFRKGIDIVFANEDEIRALFEDQTSEYAVLARRLADHGVLAAVKMGGDGAWLAEGANLHRVDPVIVSDVIDTNGAGDAWAAGFLYGYLKDWLIPACRRTGLTGRRRNSASPGPHHPSSSLGKSASAGSRTFRRIRNRSPARA